ncbi:CS1 type fimbrial major subunit [Bordetella genomosp. 9]|uniref:Adhesin n=1 Tax=Bordetella genomosp. 9 TaxID=1416803 RepID=A0A1W6YVT6_9BORD|nr:CS1 type fimbrial major subunit [Bordetella genomosp. 9]ARP85104.1 hypothetical protein CAL13_01880 [Bordetella genomosp. 9]
MFKNLVAISSLVLASGVAVAETQNMSVTVSADIPTSTFYVTTTSDWNAGEVQAMPWDATNGKLGALQRNLLAKSTIGPITGYLLSEPTISTADGANSIALDVQVNKKTLPVGATSAPELITAADAANERAYPLHIAPNGNTFNPGKYTGTVAMVFESVAP